MTERVRTVDKWLAEERLIAIGRIWCAMAATLFLVRLVGQAQYGWTDGAGTPFGEDFTNFWSGAYLSATGNWQSIYDFAAFHHFEESVVGAQLDLYHYSYPPVTWLFTAPLALFPYPAAWLLWQLGGFLALALALRRIAPRNWLLLSLAPPAIFINAMGGQNGCWTAASIAWGLILLRRRPLLAGAILSIFVVKPQLGWVIPIALLAGRHYRALAAFAISAASTLLLSVLVYGLDAWIAYAQQAQLLKAVILEHGSGTWHRMLSVFVLVRHAGAAVEVAYAAQAAASVLVAALVYRTWHIHGAGPRSYALLIFGMLAGSLYVSDYDLVMLAAAAAWVWPVTTPKERAAIAAALVAPLFTASLALASGLALCALLLWPPVLLSSGVARREWLAEPLVAPVIAVGSRID